MEFLFGSDSDGIYRGTYIYGRIKGGGEGCPFTKTLNYEYNKKCGNANFLASWAWNTATHLYLLTIVILNCILHINVYYVLYVYLIRLTKYLRKFLLHISHSTVGQNPRKKFGMNLEIEGPCIKLLNKIRLLKFFVTLSLHF